MTTLPVITESTTRALSGVIPHFTDGSGWTSEILMVNNSDSRIEGALQFFDDGSITERGQPIVLEAAGMKASMFPYSIPPRSSRKLATAGANMRTVVGSVHVTSTSGPAPDSLAVFAYKREDPSMHKPVTISEAGARSVEGTALRLYAEKQSWVTQTGIALTNGSLSPVTAKLVLTDFDTGVFLGQTSITVPPLGHVSEFLDEVLVAPLTYRGVLQISSSASLSVMGFRSRYNYRNDFLITTLEPFPESSEQPQLEVIPHFVDAGGYTTQFIVLGRSQGMKTSGMLRFFSTQGQPMSLNLR